MVNRTFIAALFTMVLYLLPAAVFATQALVRAYETPELSIGQAYLSQYKNHCIALMPFHVAQEAKTPALLREGKKGLIGDAEQIVDLGDDLALGIVSGEVNKDCGYSMSTIPRSVNSLLQRQGIGSLRSVNSDGTIAHMAVTVVDNDGATYLRIQPTNEKNQIRKGSSGSLLMVNNKPVGLLLSVSARRGIGKVIRFDALLARAEKYLANSSSPVWNSLRTNVAADAINRLDSRNLALASNGAELIAWSQIAVSAEHRPGNLINGDLASFWRIEVDKWPVSVDLDLAGEKTALRQISLLTGTGYELAESPVWVEVLVNANSEKPRWRSLLQGEVKFDRKGRSTFVFAPTWVRQLRLVFHGTQAGGSTLSLGAIEVEI